jgi:hypothetical protein
MLLHTNVADACVVGIGSGMTCGAILAHPEVRRLDAVEISPEVARCARVEMGPANLHALDDPRTTVVLDDAKSFLRASGRRYDVIISEPSNPWMAGVSGVFSLEFYEQCRASLKPGGVMTQWVQVYETSDAALRTVLATFTAVFPHFTIWQTLPGDLILVGAPEPRAWDWRTMEARAAVPAVRDDLRRADIYRLPALLALQLVSPVNAPFLAPPETPLHSDFLPVLEYLAQVGFFVRREATLPRTFDEQLARRPVTLLADYLRRGPLGPVDYRALMLFHEEHRLPHPAIMRSVLEAWRAAEPQSLEVAEYAARSLVALPASELEAARMRPLLAPMLAAATTNAEPLRLHALHLLNAYRGLRSVYYQPPVDELLNVLDRLVEVDARHRRSHQLRRAEILWDLGRDADFLALAQAAFAPGAAGEEPTFELDFHAPGQVLWRVMETHLRAGRLAEAAGWARAARAGGYLAPDSRHYSPLAEMTARKAEALAGVPPPGG